MKSILLLTTLFLLSPTMLQPTNKSISSKGLTKANNITQEITQNETNCIFDFGESAVSTTGFFKCTLKYDWAGEANLSFEGNIKVVEEHHDGTNCYLELMLPKGQGELQIIIANEEESHNAFIYSSYSSNGQFHVSSLSQYAADYDAGNIENQDLFDNDELSATYVEPASNEKRITPPKVTRAIGDGRVYGYLKWTDAQGNDHPLIGAKVKLTFDWSWGNVTTYTNSSGYYDMSFSNMWTASFDFVTTIHIYAEGDNCSVTNSGGTVYEKAYTVSGLSASKPYDYSYTFKPSVDGDLGRAMSIFTAIKNYADYARNLNGGRSFDSCKIKYPTSDGAYYNSNSINLGNETMVYDSSCPPLYACWDTIGHEYGHHLQKCFFNHDYFGDHFAETNDFRTYLVQKNTSNSSSYVLPSSDYYNAKTQSMGLAWSESWPTFFAISSQHYFSSDIKSIATVGDAIYQASNGVYTVLDDTSRKEGEMDEDTIMRFLYQLWDTNNYGEDQISISDSDLWTIMVSTNPEFFYSFISSLYNSGLSFSRWDLGRLLEFFKFSASGISVNANMSNFAVTPTITWTRNGVDVEYNHYTYSLSNDKFDIFIYDENSNDIFQKYNLTGSSYTFTQDEWDGILLAAGTTYKVMIKAYDTFGRQSGPYYSGVHQFNKPLVATYTPQLNSTEGARYFEKRIVIPEGGKWRMNVSFPFSGRVAIQTFGQEDTIIKFYRANGTTLINDFDDEGYGNNALGILNAVAGQTYVIEVALWDNNRSGRTKLAITPFMGDLEHNYSSFSTYESFLNINTYHNFTWYSGLSENRGSILSWTPPANGNYTVSLESSFDNYLYVIDPESNELLRRNYDYNDDANGNNAAVTNDYLSSKTYLVVYTQYNPFTNYSDRSITVRFTINHFN